MILASTLTTNLAILVLAVFLGFEVISKVPNTLAHAADVGHERDPRDRAARRPACWSACPGWTRFSKALLVIAVAFGTINVVGGFLVTDRMLEMFKAKPKPTRARRSRGRRQGRRRPGRSES